MALLDDSPVTCMLPVKDLARARAFYEQRLGLTPLGAKPDGKFVYRSGGIELARLRLAHTALDALHDFGSALAAALAGAGPHVDHAVGREHHGGVVLHHHHAAAARDAAEEGGGVLGFLVGHAGHRLVHEQELGILGEQHADLVEELAEALRRTLLVPHQGQLVLDQRMIDHGKMRGVGHARASMTALRVVEGRMAASVRAWTGR